MIADLKEEDLLEFSPL